MSGSARLAALALCAAMAAACEPPFEPLPNAEQRILVHAVLDLGSDRQIVFVERTVQIPGDFFAIRGATVSVTTPEGHVITAVEDRSDSVVAFFRPAVYRFRMSDEPVALSPGGTYALRIETPTGAVVTGSTTVPSGQIPPDSGTVSSFSRASDTLRLSWPRVPGAGGYHVSVNTRQTFGSFSFTKVYNFFADTAIALAGTARTIDDDAVFPPGRSTVLVAAVDDNYHTYYRPAVDPFAGAPASRLTGAVGVFGSIVPVMIRRLDVR